MKKKAFWVSLGSFLLAGVVIGTLALWSLNLPKQQSFDLMSPAEVRELKAQLLSGHTDPDAASRPPAGREGSPSSASEQYYMERAYPAADIPDAAYTNGFNQYSLMSQPGSGSFGWKELGPLSTPNGSTWGNAEAGTVSGRGTAIAVDPSSCSAGACQTIYLGTANGGVWKSTTGGHNWIPLTEHQSTMAIGALALDPRDSSIIYAGTGEPNNASDNDRGQGILKSTNGGHTWTTLGFNTFVNHSIADIVVDPSNGNLYAISYMARSGGSGTTPGGISTNPYLPAVGFYRSTDGGASWTLSNPTASLTVDPTGRAGGTSLVRAADNTIYLAIYAQGIYKSRDGGVSWTSLPNAHETALQFDRVTLAPAPSDANILYAAYGHDIDGPGGLTFYASTDGGATWTARPHIPSPCTTQCWYDMPLAVSPTNPSEVYVGGMYNYNGCPTTYPYNPTCTSVIMKSLDSGATWYEIGSPTTGVNVHPDDHAIVSSAQGGLYTANDGGLYHSSNDGTSWESLNNGLGTLTFQGVSANSNGDVFGGTQDNGTWMLRNSSTDGVHILGGDGGMTAADPNNPNIVFDELYGTQLERFDVAGGRQTWMAGWWADYFVFKRGQFYQPIALGNKTPTGASASNDVFSGSYRLWRSTSGGGVDANRDGDATNDPSDTTDFVPITGNVGNITAIAVSPVDPNHVAFATNTGSIYYTENALAPVQLDNACATHHGDIEAAYCAALHINPALSGTQMCSQPWTNAFDTSSFCDYHSGVTWTRLDVNGSNAKLVPGRVVTSLTFAPGSASTLFVTFSGFDENTPSNPGHVFVTSNPGASVTWTNITGSGATAIPNLPANRVVVTPGGRIVVAADFGIFSSKDGGVTWKRDDYTLANAPVYDLALSPDGKTIYAATHGRGIWRANVPGA